MTTTEILERAECAKDTKARRVSNVAPNTIANVTAATLESGVELEALESLNVPVFRYGTQITIHGKLLDFDESARRGAVRQGAQAGQERFSLAEGSGSRKGIRGEFALKSALTQRPSPGRFSSER